MSEESSAATTTSEPLIASPLLAKKFEESKLKAAKSLTTLSKSSKFVWHAWLGSAATAEKSVVDFAKSMTMKGTVFTKTMATKGIEIEAKAKAELTEKLSKAKSKSMLTREKISGISKAKIDDVEKMISKGLNKSLHVVGVPTRGDVDKLALLMSDMSSTIEELAAISGQKSKRSTTSKPASA
jgi:hypothetical protein